MSGKTPIVCIIGPTASGKSGRAIALAKERNGEIISVDSRQVYRMLDIGTEKISKEEMQGVPHHLIDIRDPKESYSAGDFAKDATHLIEDITKQGKLPILAGGSHFYFDALINGIPGETPMDPVLRESLEKMSDEELFEKIKEGDPSRAETIDPKNRRRLVRALEIITLHGKVPERSKASLYDVEWIVLLPEREELRARIEARLKETLEKGLIDEVRRVRDYVGDERLNELGLEYRIVGEYLRGERDEETLLHALTAKLFQYARRQEAWIKKLESSSIRLR
ncbi:MAG TPA: tRNA (adenosine(37)-N6)-dimethylallyltransferase MiaA [Candidatus Paceibacterota bacterium]|nr:tRNA (adenosine(37)-N6)-dimethylallyltransferase MiaA [Candidatus Paceibacterota bacterium]